MIPVLYASNAASFSTFGIGTLTDTISCEVTEERNGLFECLLRYPVDGQHYGQIAKERIKAKRYLRGAGVSYLPDHKAHERRGVGLRAAHQL